MIKCSHKKEGSLVLTSSVTEEFELCVIGSKDAAARFLQLVQV